MFFNYIHIYVFNFLVTRNRSQLYTKVKKYLPNYKCTVFTKMKFNKIIHKSKYAMIFSSIDDFIDLVSFPPCR